MAANKEMYSLATYSEHLPFQRFVSKCNLADNLELDITTNGRRFIEYKISKLIKQTAHDATARFQPIVGESGCGKTHFYWVLKAKEYKLTENIGFEEVPFKIIYVPSPPTPYRFFHHIYTCIVDEIASDDFFLAIADIILKQNGLTDPKELCSENFSNILAKALTSYPGIFGDCVKIILTLKIFEDKSPKRSLAQRWLLAESLSEADLEQLGVSSILEQDDLCLAMIKIISDLSSHILVFYFDEMEIPYRIYGEEVEKKIFENIKRIYNEVRYGIIITSCLDSVWEHLLEAADDPMKSRMEDPLKLDLFEESDLKVFYLRAMSKFWETVKELSKENVDNQLNPYFPLSEDIIHQIFVESKGNQRICIKLINKYIEEFIALHAGEMIDMKVLPYVTKQPKTSNSKQTEHGSIEEMADPINDPILKEPTPGNVLNAILIFLHDYGHKNNIEFEILLDFKYKIGTIEREIGCMISFNEKMVGLDIPSIKTFEKPAGVAAFYSAKRLHEATTNNILDKGIVITTHNSNGAKLQSLLKQNPLISTFEITPESAKQICRKEKSIIAVLDQLAKKIFD